MLILSNIAKLYDGTSATEAALHTNVDVFIDGGRIHDCKPHDPRFDTAGDHGDATVVDLSGKVVTPGLIDCHGHITVLGLDPGSMDVMLSGSELVYVEKILHTTLVDGGVTTMRDIAGATDMMKRLVDEGAMIGPRLKIAICMLSATGGHADFRGPDRCHAELSRLWPERAGRPSSVVDGPWECRKRVREIAACGADLIKLCTSPGVASPSDKLEHRDFTAEEIEAICEEAGARGLKVAAHAHSRSGIELAIQHGVSDIQHISFMDDRLAEMAHKRGCTVTPTSWVMGELTAAEGLSPFVMEKVKRVADVHSEATRAAHSAGLKILAGTDPILPRMHGRNYMELVALMDEGLSSLDAWYAGTGLAATEIGQDDAGSLRPGQRADLLICNADVIEQPRSLDPEHGAALVEVLKDGVGHRGGLTGLPQTTYSGTVRPFLWPEARG